MLVLVFVFVFVSVLGTAVEEHEPPVKMTDAD